MKSLQIIRDGNKTNTFAIPAPDYVKAVVLVAGVNQNIPVPTDAKEGFVIFSQTAPFYAKIGGTATVPGATTNDGSASMLNPSVWSLEGVTAIGMISPYACVVTLTFFKR